MIASKRINNVSNPQIPQKYIGAGDVRSAKGHKLFSDPYSNIYCLARKKAGKTTAIFNILKKCVGRDTKVIIFCSTVNKDKSYQAIKNYLKEREISCLAYTEFIDEEKNDILADFINGLKKEIPDEEESDSEPEYKYDMYGHKNPDEKKKRKSIYQEPEYIFILDDLSDAMRHRTVTKLLKTNRHYKAKVILSSQYITDIAPAGLRQIDYFLAFSGQTPEKLKAIHKYADLNIGLDKFEEIYEHATKEPYNFLYIYGAGNELRRNFNEKYFIANS